MARTGDAQANNARVIFPSEATIYKVPNLHTSDSASRYQRRATASVSETQLEILERCRAMTPIGPRLRPAFAISA